MKTPSEEIVPGSKETSRVQEMRDLLDMRYPDRWDTSEAEAVAVQLATMHPITQVVFRDFCEGHNQEEILNLTLNGMLEYGSTILSSLYFDTDADRDDLDALMDAGLGPKGLIKVGMASVVLSRLPHPMGEQYGDLGSVGITDIINWRRSEVEAFLSADRLIRNGIELGNEWLDLSTSTGWV